MRLFSSQREWQKDVWRNMKEQQSVRVALAVASGDRSAWAIAAE